VLGLSEGGLGGQDAPDGFPASGRNAYPPRANAFFADVPCRAAPFNGAKTSSNTPQSVSAFFSLWSLSALEDFASLGEMDNSARSRIAIDPCLLRIVD